MLCLGLLSNNDYGPLGNLVLSEYAATVRRMHAMERLFVEANLSWIPLQVNPFQFLEASLSRLDPRSFLDLLQEELALPEAPSLLQRVLGQSQTQNLDPEAVVLPTKLLMPAKVVPKFELNILYFNLKQLKELLAPLFLASAILNSLRSWEHPVLTSFFIAFLLNMAYMDFLVYIPALFILLNVVVIIILRGNPEFLELLFYGTRDENLSVGEVDGKKDKNKGNDKEKEKEKEKEKDKEKDTEPEKNQTFLDGVVKQLRGYRKVLLCVFWYFNYFFVLDRIRCKRPNGSVSTLGVEGEYPSAEITWAVHLA
jgi:hypothetical protein